MVTMSTFRAGEEIIISDPSNRTDKDTTTWSFHPTTGLELSKTYADNTSVTKTYDAYNRLTTETDARGNVKTHAYEHARGLLLSTSYSDGTTARQFSYNHLGQVTQVTDDAGTRLFSYNSYGEKETDSLLADGITHLLTEKRDLFGRNIGYTYTKNLTNQQTVNVSYGADGRIATAGFVHGGVERQFTYEYLTGSDLLQKLSMPNNMTLTQSCEEKRDLLTSMQYHRGNTLVTQRDYSYDTMGRPLTRRTARQGKVVNDTFTHNTRFELTAALVNGKNYEYNYDNIGNRLTATEAGNATSYTANELNQYTSIQENEEAAFTPVFDANGNQTCLKTETGIWDVVYNAENRPVSFTNTESNTVVECAYDYMGRRCFKKITIDGRVTLYQRYIYRNYLQIACCDLTRSNHPALWYITWEPTQPTATRPLAIQKDGTWYTYGWDLTKNICEVYRNNGHIGTSYSYSPYGKTDTNGDIEQPLLWSSEAFDETMSLYYYNYRHFARGYWISRDLSPVNSARNLYSFDGNTLKHTDILGLFTIRVETEGLGHVGIDVGKTSWDFGRYFSKYKWDLETDDICLDTELFGKRINCRLPLNSMTKRAEELANDKATNTGPLIIKKGFLNTEGKYTRYTYVIQDKNIKKKIDKIIGNVLLSIFDSGIRLENVSEDITNRLVKDGNYYSALKDEKNRRYLNTDWSIRDNCVTRAVEAIRETAKKALESNDSGVRQVGKKILNDFSDATMIPAPDYMNIWLERAKENGIVEKKYK